MKATILTALLVISLIAPACANNGRRRQPQPNGRPDKTDHVQVRKNPLNLGQVSLTVDGYERDDNRGDCRDSDRCRK